MAAPDTHAIRAARLRAFRRRRATLGLACAIAAVAAGGVGLAGADPSLKDRIDSARSDAGQLSDQVDAQTSRLASLIEQARRAGAQAMVLNAEVERADARSQQLAAQLEAAEKRLEQLRRDYAEAVKQLDQRLIAIYESETPDEVTVMLNSEGFDDLSTRSDYLQALHEADLRIANRVDSLRDQVADRVDEVADLKQQAQEQERELTAARASSVASQEAANRSAEAVVAARSHTQADLAAVQDRVDELEAEQAAQQSSSSGAPAYLGGPYSIPTYIVMCESGGNYNALNPSSGAGGAYQILSSTWAAYGGQGEPQNAPKAEQDRIAAEIWADSGPGAWSCA